MHAIEMLKTVTRRTKNLVFYGHYIPPEYYIIDDHKLVYISIPKVACTSIKIATMSDSLKSSKLGENYMDIHMQASKYCISRLGKLQKDYFKFAFVRSPFDRLVSCYEDKVSRERHRNGQYYFSSSYNKLLIRAIAGNEFHHQMTFEEFVKLVSKIPDYLADGHFKSQYSVLYRNKKRVPDFVGKFENLSQDWGILADKFGLKPLSQKNKSSRRPYNEYYQTREIIDLAAKRYQKDIEHFQYQDEYQKLLNSVQ